MTNCAQLSFTGGVPVSSCVSIPVVGQYTVKIGVYNEAGEIVMEFPVVQCRHSCSRHVECSSQRRRGEISIGRGRAETKTRPPIIGQTTAHFSFDVSDSRNRELRLVA